MKQLFTTLLLLTIALTGCGKGNQGEYISLSLKQVAAGDSLWYLYSYSTEHITIDTIAVTADGSISWKKKISTDSLDLLLLFNQEGLLEIPFLPNRNGEISALVDPEGLQLKGVLEVDRIQGWLEAKKQGMASLVAFLSGYKENSLALVLVADAIHRDTENACWAELQEILYPLHRDNPNMVALLGLKLLPEGELPQEVPYGFKVVGKENYKSFREFIGKRAYMAINIMHLNPEDSTTFEAQKQYLARLDSLKVLSYNVLLNEELPKGVAKPPLRHFLVDSTGLAVEYLQNNNIEHIPTYMLVDSTQKVWRKWEEADSLIQFIKEYNNARRRVD